MKSALTSAQVAPLELVTVLNAPAANPSLNALSCPYCKAVPKSGAALIP